MEPNLEAHVTYDPPNFSWPFGTHICVVEVDEETGQVDVLQYVAVDDCGNQINPLIVEGQIHGGIIQGLAQALFEEAVYDADGNLQHVDPRRLPGARRARRARHRHSTSTVTPSPTNPLGREGHRRGRHHRRRPRGHQRGRRRPVAPRRHRHRHAGLARTKVWSAIQAASRTDQQEAGLMIPAAFDYARADSADEAIAPARPSTATTPSCSPAATRCCR